MHGETNIKNVAGILKYRCVDVLFSLDCLTIEDENTADLSKRREPLARHSVAFQKSWLLGNTAIITSKSRMFTSVSCLLPSFSTN